MHTIYTIGYGNRDLLDMVKVLQSYGVKTLVDVRSDPHSKWRPELNRWKLKRTLGNHGHLHTAGQGRSAGVRVIKPCSLKAGSIPTNVSGQRNTLSGSAW